MINLIRNEIKKQSKFKILFSYIIVIITIYIIIYLNKDKNSLNTIFTLIPFLSILICIVFGNIVSNEFHTGTIRIYLTKPYKRYKILLSKLFIIYIYILLLLIIVVCSYYFLSSFYIDINIDFNYIKEVIIHFIPMFFVGALIIFLSTFTCSTASTVGISIMICFVANLISQLLIGFGYNLVKYTFLPYMDFNMFKDSEYLLFLKEFNVDISINKGIIILLIYTIFTIILSLIVFCKKDIKN